MQSEKSAQSTVLTAAVIVAALGYFVDIYDLILFSIVRVESLKALGVTADTEITRQGLFLINMQMGGMLLGGVLWGVLGDKKGRLSVLFGSILLYSLANLANGFVTTIGQYAALRLIAGIGLAGELGAGITLVSEGLPKEKRGLGTMLVATVGVSGALLGYWVGNRWGWRNAYLVGGGLGLALLLLRVSVFESGMFQKDPGRHGRGAGPVPEPVHRLGAARQVPAGAADWGAAVVCGGHPHHPGPGVWAGAGPHRAGHGRAGGVLELLRAGVWRFGQRGALARCCARGGGRCRCSWFFAEQWWAFTCLALLAPRPTSSTPCASGWGWRWASGRCS